MPEVNCNDGGRPSDTSRISNESAVASVTNLPDDNATCRYEQDANEALGDSADVGNGQTSMSDGDFALLQLPSSSPGTATLEWFDLLAQDAIRNIQKHNHSTSGWRWNFDERALSRKQSPISGAPGHATPMLASVQMSEIGNRDGEPWNTAHSIVLCEKELIYFQYYVNIVGPVLDLFDPIKHFTIMVPHLALHNVGLLKSLLAVAARHMTLHGIELPLDANPNVQTPGSSLGGLDTHEATQYYYETLTYLSHTMAYPSYTKSLEILATAIMIGAYEMFDGSNRDWERHLKGAFWIQRCQDNDGESGGLRTAVWWAWLRQDIWAAFRDRRKALTIWQPKKPLHSLTTDELATRILYILAKVIQYSSYEESNTADISTRIEQGNKLWTDLQDWYNILPASFRPISVTQDAADAFFETIWIHPPAHAAAIQSYHFAKIVLLLNQPHVGGINVYHSRQKRLDESVRIICGIAQSIQAEQLPSATVNAQALFAGIFGVALHVFTQLTMFWKPAFACRTLKSKRHFCEYSKDRLKSANSLQNLLLTIS